MPLLNPTWTAGEVIRPRGADGRITGVVRTQQEARFSTVDLLAAEHELLTRATARRHADAATVPAKVVEQVLDGADLDGDQEAMVRTVTGSGAGVDVVAGKAGTGKTTAIRTAHQAWTETGHPVVGVAPSAAAAHQLGKATGMNTSTLDRLLVKLDVGKRTLPPGVVVILDEAGMCSTRNRLRLQRAVDHVDGKVVDIGDHRQVPSVDVGGCFHALGQTLGASTLDVNHRFRDVQYRDAAELVADGHADKGIALLESLGAVYEHAHPEVVYRRMTADWAHLQAQGFDARMYATTNDAVDTLNHHTRTHLQTTGALPRRGRTYESTDGHRAIHLVQGERIRLGRNQAIRRLDGTLLPVRNGMTGTTTRLDRTTIRVELDEEHRDPGGPAEITLPASYVGEHVGYGYATTSDRAQGATVDHTLFAPSGFGSLERDYVGLSRGIWTNRIYAVTGNGWRDSAHTRAGHTPALAQTPDPDHPFVRAVQQTGRADAGWQDRTSAASTVRDRPHHDLVEDRGGEPVASAAGTSPQPQSTSTFDSEDLDSPNRLEPETSGRPVRRPRDPCLDEHARTPDRTERGGLSL